MPDANKMLARLTDPGTIVFLVGCLFALLGMLMLFDYIG